MGWRIKPRAKISLDTVRVQALFAIRDLMAEALAEGEPDPDVEFSDDFIPAYEIVMRLGTAPGLGIVLEELGKEGLVERGQRHDGTWGDRLTESGFAEIAKLTGKRS